MKYYLTSLASRSLAVQAPAVAPEDAPQGAAAPKPDRMRPGKAAGTWERPHYVVNTVDAPNPHKTHRPMKRIIGAVMCVVAIVAIAAWFVLVN